MTDKVGVDVRNYICSVDGCDIQAWSRGWCGKHYANWRRHGDPELRKLRPYGLSLEEAFRWHMPGDPPTEGCWLWTSGLDNNGYGSLWWKKSIGAHVASYQIFKGPIESGLWVLHSCNTPACVNPDHLRLGEPIDNSRDRVEAGNSCKGVENANSKLTDSAVRLIRSGREEGRTMGSLARDFGVSRKSISNVLNGRTWNHVI